MAGHSKWSNIQHRKGRQDAKRAKIFTKIIREITVAARNGSDSAHNPALRLALEKAYRSNMNKDAIERAIKRGSGEQNSESYFSVTYEGYGSQGVAILVDCLTDNINRTVSDVRHAFSKNGGNLGTTGSVSYLFNPVGFFVVKTKSEDEFLEAILEFDLVDIQEIANEETTSKEKSNEKIFEIYSQFCDYEPLKRVFEKSGFELIYSELTKKCDNQIECDVDLSEKVNKVIEALEDLDDVQSVYHNANLL